MTIRLAVLFCCILLMTGCAMNRWDLKAYRHFDAMNHAQEDVTRVVSYRVPI